MASDNKSSKKPDWGETVTQLINVVANALDRLMRISTGTIVALGILGIVAAITWRATPEVQREILNLLVGLLAGIIGPMLASRGTSSSGPTEPPTPSE